MTRYRTLRAAPLLAALLLLSGCPWKKENEELKKQNAQLNQDKERLEGEATAAGAANTEMQGTLDDVEKNLEELRIKELKVIRSSIEVSKEGKAAPSKRQQLLTDIAEIRKAVKENLDKLALLEQQKKAAMKKADALGKKVTTLERLIEELKAQLTEKETTIAALEEKVLSLSQTVTTQAGQIQQQQGVIETQTTDLNTAYFVIGTKNELKKAGLVEKKGSVLGLGGNWKQTGLFDEEKFTKIDIRTNTEFTLAAPMKKVRVLSDHPKDSYEIVDSATPGTSTLKVTDAARFWKQSKVLVVMLPG